MIFQQFRHEAGSCLSYLFGCTRTGVCAVVDSQLKVEPYLKLAEKQKMKITHIFETHSQADHLSGARKLSEISGAPVYFHESVRVGMPVVKVKDGQQVRLGNVVIKVLHTPGHTPDSLCFLVSDTTRSDDPWLVLTGDTLFVGDTGRPDLEGDAGQLYDSIWGKLLTLDDIVEVYPTHYSGSVCGRSMSPKPISTIGFEKRFNPSLQVSSKQEFIEFVTANLPLQPPRFKKVREFNLGFLKEPPIEKTYDVQDLQITVEELKQRIDSGKAPFLLDVRESFEREYADIGGRLIPLGQIPKRLTELDPKQEIVVYCHHGNRSQRVVEFLYENGFTNVKNLTGGIEEWTNKIDPTVPRY